MQLTPPEVEK
nr:RecName: Full=Urease subunit gamma; AltName: Full=Urea amidohydrolase subunit gamma; AltName: Full=Urease 6 kDa subunit [Morganella morganii]